MAFTHGGANGKASNFTKLREAEWRYFLISGREGELMNVTVQRREGRVVLIDLDVRREFSFRTTKSRPSVIFQVRIKALLREVSMTSKVRKYAFHAAVRVLFSRSSIKKFQSQTAWSKSKRWRANPEVARKWR